MSEVICIPVGGLLENCYIVKEDNHLLLIDPGAQPSKIMSVFQKEDILDGIILTHGHSDHTQAIDDIVEKYPCNVYVSKDEYPMISKDFQLNLGYYRPVYTPCQLIEEGELQVGIFHLKVYATPGHTIGGICIQYKDHLFTGDTLFAGDCGRSDLYLGDEDTLMNSLSKLSKLDHHLKVHPGHGPSSTIGQELMCNPYIPK